MFVLVVACGDGAGRRAVRRCVGDGCICYVDADFVAERAVPPVTGVVRWVVVDAGSFDLQTEAVAFLASLRARGCSPNTERAYAGRVALYLSYCRVRRLDWRIPGFLDLVRAAAVAGRDPCPAPGRPGAAGSGPLPLPGDGERGHDGGGGVPAVRRCARLGAG